MKPKRKYFTLDYKIWICGRGKKTRPRVFDNKGHGCGLTSLLNLQGYMCCLGQFEQQLGVSKENLASKEFPSVINIKSNRKYFDPFVEEISDSVLSSKCMNINDSQDTTIAQKVYQLRQELKDEGYILRLKNFPKRILRELSQIKKEKQV